MRAWAVWGLAIAACGMAGPATALAAEPGDKVWLKDYEEAKAAAKKAGKPIFAVLR